MAPGLLFVYWYEREHIPMLLAVPGALSRERRVLGFRNTFS